MATMTRPYSKLAVPKVQASIPCTASFVIGIQALRPHCRRADLHNVSVNLLAFQL